MKKPKKAYELQDICKVVMPKKPLSSYIVFCNERRPLLLKENPSLTILEASKLIGKEWHKLDDKKKNKLSKIAEKDI